MKYRLIISAVFVAVAVSVYANEEPKELENKPTKELTEAAESPVVVKTDEKADAKETTSDNMMWYIIGGIVVAIVGYALYRRASRSNVVVSFDDLLSFAELAKNSGAYSVTAFRLSSMPEEQRKILLDQMGLTKTFKIKGYNAEFTLVVAQLDENENVISQRVYYGHSFDERLSAAFSAQTMLKIALK
jgi:hypothetical protein